MLNSQTMIHPAPCNPNTLKKTLKNRQKIDYDFHDYADYADYRL